jgi:hypothetical protein
MQSESSIKREKTGNRLNACAMMQLLGESKLGRPILEIYAKCRWPRRLWNSLRIDLLRFPIDRPTDKTVKLRGFILFGMSLTTEKLFEEQNWKLAARR